MTQHLTRTLYHRCWNCEIQTLAYHVSQKLNFNFRGLSLHLIISKNVNGRIQINITNTFSWKKPHKILAWSWSLYTYEGLLSMLSSLSQWGPQCTDPFMLRFVRKNRSLFQTFSFISTSTGGSAEFTVNPFTLHGFQMLLVEVMRH